MTKQEINKIVQALKEGKVFSYEHSQDYMGGYQRTYIYYDLVANEFMYLSAQLHEIYKGKVEIISKGITSKDNFYLVMVSYDYAIKNLYDRSILNIFPIE